MIEKITPRLSWRLAELAAASGLSIPFLRKMIAEGRLKIRRVGSAVIILDEDARAFLAGKNEAQFQAESLKTTA